MEVHVLAALLDASKDSLEGELYRLNPIILMFRTSVVNATFYLNLRATKRRQSFDEETNLMKYLLNIAKNVIE